MSKHLHHCSLLTPHSASYRRRALPVPSARHRLQPQWCQRQHPIAKASRLLTAARASLSWHQQQKPPLKILLPILPRDCFCRRPTADIVGNRSLMVAFIVLRRWSTIEMIDHSLVVSTAAGAVSAAISRMTSRARPTETLWAANSSWFACQGCAVCARLNIFPF